MHFRGRIEGGISTGAMSRMLFSREPWYYEALLMKCYDSATDGRTRFRPHTAFVDPTTPVNAASRESIEVRTLVFHKS